MHSLGFGAALCNGEHSAVVHLRSAAHPARINPKGNPLPIVIIPP